MDFDDAAQRLARDQKKIRGRTPVVVSATAKRQAEMQRKQRERLQAEREQKRRREEYQKQYMRDCEKALHVKNLGNQSDEPLLLQPTSIHGTGDKIGLPPSVLEILTNELGNSLGSPWTFRIGILNPEYLFPASPLIQNLKLSEDSDYDGHDDAMQESDDEGERDNMLPFLDELMHKYIAYTHCTVVEFTQDEGYVGIPRHVASALLDPRNRLPIFADRTVPITRTIDPAMSSSQSDDAQNTTTDSVMTAVEDDPTMATPGHIAYGAFDIPAVHLEISLVNLPKGKGCTLVPSKEAIQRGFYGLKDVKLVLEQSLIRTRATLSQGDIVSTWHRGVQYDLNVAKVTPSAFQAVTCINTDIEVEIGENSADQADPTQANDKSPGMTSPGHTLGPGRTLGSATSQSSDVTTIPIQPPSPLSTIALLPEPPVEKSENIVTVQIQFSGGNGKRRFDIHKATVRDLFQYASSLMSSREISTFRLVTRFPRRVFNGDSFASTLQEEGIRPGQELFIVELV